MLAFALLLLIAVWLTLPPTRRLLPPPPPVLLPAPHILTLPAVVVRLQNGDSARATLPACDFVSLLVITLCERCVVDVTIPVVATHNVGDYPVPFEHSRVGCLNLVGVVDLPTTFPPHPYPLLLTERPVPSFLRRYPFVDCSGRTLPCWVLLPRLFRFPLLPVTPG